MKSGFRVQRCVVYLVREKSSLLHKVIGLFLLATMLLWPYYGPLYASGSNLDPTFGNEGKVVTSLGMFSDQAESMAIQPDGKIIVAGSTSNGGDFALARYLPNGILDSSFGSGGFVITDFGTGSEDFRDVKLQSDGKIVAGGVACFVQSTMADFALARFHTDGTVDRGFGIGGRVTTDFFGDSDQIHALGIQPDGRIVATGFASRPGVPSNIAIARYNSDGSLDQSFALGGKTITVLSSFDRGMALALLPDGNILVAGNTAVDFAVLKYTADGRFDTSFGFGGVVTTDLFGSFDFALALAVQNDGKIIVAGETIEFFPNVDFGLVRYNSNGTLDSSFGLGGKVATDFFGFDDGVLDIKLESGGKIVAAGHSRTGPSLMKSDFAMARYKNDGTLDSTLGTSGKITTDFLGQRDEIFAIAIQPDGKIVAAGFADADSQFNSDIALARYLGGPGFDKCLQDDSTGNVFLLNSASGEYQFTVCSSGFVLSGVSSLFRRGSSITLQHDATDRRVLAKVDGSANKGSASIHIFSLGATFTVLDRNTNDNTCVCP